MGERTGKPGPDPKTDFEKLVVPPPYRKGGASGEPLVEVAKRDRRELEDFQRKVRGEE